MKERKRVLKNFRYRECDAFAGYLSEQARQGWHFKEWRLGLVFEKGEPAVVEYIVEVFPEGAEMDTKPARDTEEYAEYCEAAGWKLVDSKRKFCIFRKEKPDALPIVTPEERFCNVKNAEWKLWIYSYMGMLCVTALDWFQFWKLNFKRWIFNDVMIFVLFAVTLFALFSVLDLISVRITMGRKKRQLEAGEIPVYGRKLHGHVNWRWGWSIICGIAVCILAYREGFQNIIIVFVAFAGVIALISMIIELRRPARADHWMIQFGESGLLLLVLLIMIVAMLADQPTQSDLRDNASLQEFPLIQTDYREIDGSVDFTDIGELDGIFGSERYCAVVYVLDKSGEDSEDAETDWLSYDIYRTQYPWILQKMWSEEINGLTAEEATAPDAWGAVAAYCNENGYYRILYPDTMILLSAEEKLSEAQIQAVCRKLGLD